MNDAQPRPFHIRIDRELTHPSQFHCPTVAHLAAYLPEAVTTAHRLFLVVANPVTGYWWVALIPLLSTAAALYVGRCLVLFERHENEKA